MIYRQIAGFNYCCIKMSYDLYFIRQQCEKSSIATTSSLPTLKKFRLIVFLIRCFILLR